MIEKIQETYNGLSRSDKQIADYFLANRREIVTQNMNIQQVAEGAGTSSASVSRFVQKVFGLNFADTKLELALNLGGEENPDSQLGWSLPLDEIPQALAEGMNTVIDGILKKNRMQDLEEIMDVIAAADTVYLFGSGSSGLAAQDMTQKLVGLGKKALYTIDANLAMINASLCTEKDAVIAVSNSGTTKGVVVPARKSAELGAKVIAVCGSARSKLCTVSDYKIVVPNNEPQHLRLTSIYARFGQFFVIDILFIGIAKKLSVRPEDLTERYGDILLSMK